MVYFSRMYLSYLQSSSDTSYAMCSSIYTIKDGRVSRWMGYSVSSEQRTPTDYVYIEVTLPVSGDFVFCDAV
jgi:hypothetical protein